MNAVVILNLRDFLPMCARASFQHAAARWGATYLEITEALGPMHHFWQKAIIPSSPHVARFERVLQLDCDMLVRSDCPSPFDVVPATNFGVVSRVQTGNPLHLLRYLGKKAAKKFALDAYPDEFYHINAGFILYNTAAHAKELRLWFDAGKHCRWANWLFPEQLALSCILHQTNVPTTWLPSEWNCLHPWRVYHAGARAFEQPGQSMQANVYHFNRPRGRQPLKSMMENVQWDMTCQK